MNRKASQSRGGTDNAPGTDSIRVRSGFGILGSETYSAYISSGTVGNTPNGTASYKIDDLIVTAPGDETTANIALNLILRGKIEGGAHPYGFAASSRADVEIRVTINEGAYDYTGTLTAIADTQVGSVTLEDSGLLDGLLDGVPLGDAAGGDYQLEYNIPIATIVTTPVFSVATDTLFSLEITITTSANTLVGDGAAVTNCEFFNGLILPRQDGTFVTDPGFTVNSASAKIVDNRILAWRGYDMDMDGWADTGEWIGWINALHAPWIWLDGLQQYIYMPAYYNWAYSFRQGNGS